MARWPLAFFLLAFFLLPRDPALAQASPAPSAAAPTAPVNLTGKWTLHVKFHLGSGDPWFEFHQEGSKLTGTYHGYFGVAPITGTVNGTDIEFTSSNDKGTGHYKGAIVGGVFKGTAKYPFPLGTGHFEGKRSN
jgi:hypothetical protein